MKIRMDALIRVVGQALDLVEIALLGVSTNHGKRVASLCAAMGRKLGFQGEELSDLVSCALLHDNALTEFSLLKTGHEENAEFLEQHCVVGQKNIEVLPFKGDIQGFILYHHERADGQGPFRLSEGYYPLGAELIAAADMIDAGRHLQRITAETLPSLRELIGMDIHHRFTGRAGEALLAVLDEEMLESLKDEHINDTVCRSIPIWELDMEDPALICFGQLIGHIIDYKSTFTRKHTTQIANRAWVMGKHYNYCLAEKIQLYLAAALHDLGKLGIPPEVLEKPGQLTQEEFEIIKTHITKTRELLSSADGLGDIVEWAANHHEKLNGKGYPLKKTAKDLDFNSRLMACIDIYQAVSEERPYHPRRSHAETMPILRNMADTGSIDPGIVNDIDKVMAAWSGRDVEDPEI